MVVPMSHSFARTGGMAERRNKDVQFTKYGYTPGAPCRRLLLVSISALEGKQQLLLTRPRAPLTASLSKPSNDVQWIVSHSVGPDSPRATRSLATWHEGRQRTLSKVSGRAARTF